MKDFTAIVLLLLTICLFSCSDQVSKNSKWQSLHPNESLSDFVLLNGQAKYDRQNNVIIGTSTLNSPNTFLATKKQYSDFELKFEVLLSEGLNSGVQIRSISDTTIMRGRVHGYQVEIEDSPRGWAGGIYDEARRGWLYPLERNPQARKAFRKGDWNAYHILAKGDTLKTWVNGIPCAQLVDTLTRSGFIGLQVHSIGDSTLAGKSIQWRNLQIKTEEVGTHLASWPQAPIANIFPAHSKSTDEFMLQPGFYIHQLAGEPQVESPVASTLDENGNLWVIELPGYMRDIDGSEEDKADGKIVVLSDLDKDGQMDRREIYKDNLVAPRTLCLVNDGLLYNSGRALYFDDFNTGITELIDSFYVQGGNIEHQPNGLYYNLDNWIYSAKSNARYRLINGKWIKEATTLRGQWGINADLHGRLIYNDNSNGLFGDQVMPNRILDNPYLKIEENLFKQLCKNNRVYPYQATAVNRGYMKGVLDEEGKIRNFTSSCSPIIYKGEGTLESNAFVCAPEANVVKRYVLKQKSAFAQEYLQAYSNKEFLLSQSETFRPVNLYNYPKGGLLLVDLRKGVIQHRAYMTHYLREKILKKGFDKIVGKGRLYLINESKDVPGNLALWPRRADLNTKVALLQHPNGAMRLAMQKHLIANRYEGSIEAVEKLLIKANNFGKIHALWTLEGLGILNLQHLEQLMSKASVEVVYHILAVMELNSDLMDQSILEKAYQLRHPQIDLSLCHLLPQEERYRKMLSDLIKRYGNKAAYAEALLAKAWDSPPNLPTKINTLQQKIAEVNNNKLTDTKVSPAIIRYQYADNRNEGFPAYSQYCASCHGLDGIGQPALAPPILYSEYIEGPSEKLAALILQGLEGPIHVNGKRYELNLVMPGLKNNPALDDATIAAIIAFVNNAFSKNGQWISPKQVGEVRAQLGDRVAPLTEKEVLEWSQQME